MAVSAPKLTAHKEATIATIVLAIGALGHLVKMGRKCGRSKSTWHIVLMVWLVCMVTMLLNRRVAEHHAKEAGEPLPSTFAMERERDTKNT